ncbi:penicillin-binding protein [Arsenicicoccus sp. oral taxon 190]|uniref:penicillin-binding protein n=1 Tax=Arsenicicoccus sp. oral taxon 190 TaxID=1658671 RepID=UPI00067D0FF2|nr:transglycosylase domain-containing protein [Arsenicicoccus sp. oral taxon 190]
MKQGRLSAIPTVMSLLTAFLAVAVVGGFLGAGLLIPATALMGTVVKSGVEVYEELPTEFTSVVPEQQSEILAADGKTVIATLYVQNRIIVPITAISPWMQKAQVSIEDHRFYEHGGVDLEGIGSAVAGAAMGGAPRGASTLTQQYVKVTLEKSALDRGDTQAAKAAKAVTASRKLQELKYAVQVEKQMTKEQILQNYLNLVYFGDQAYGVEAAARHYFRTTAAKLTVPQAATLAGVVQQPGANDPIRNPKAALARRNVVLDAMHRYGYIDAKQLAAAKASPLGVVKSDPPKNSCAAATYPFWCDYVVNYLKTLPALGATPQEREGRVLRGGYRIVTTIDPELQKQAAASMGRVISAQDYPKFGSAATTVETSTGKIRAMVQSTGYNPSGKAAPGSTQVNWAADYRYGASGGFSVGSTMKLFAVVEALKQGKGESYPIPGIRPPGTPWYPREFQAGCQPGGPLKIGNAEGDNPKPGETIGGATRNSINTAFLALSADIGTCNIRNTALEMGMHNSSRASEAPDGKPLSTYPQILLLGEDASPETMASMYAIIANRGISCPNTPIEAITDSAGKKVDLKLPGCKRVLDENIANQAAGIFQGVMTDGTGKARQIGRPAIGKTGTDADNETWFVGATPQYSTAVWAGTPDSNDGSWRNLRLHATDGSSQFYPKAMGYLIPGPIWQGIMSAAHEGLPVVPFGNAAQPVADGTSTAIPDVGGMSVEEATTTLEAAGFQVTVGGRVASGYPRGTVARTRPTSQAPKGSTITLRVSTGQRARAAAPRPNAPAPAAPAPAPAAPAPAAPAPAAPAPAPAAPAPAAPPAAPPAPAPR